MCPPQIKAARGAKIEGAIDLIHLPTHLTIASLQCELDDVMIGYTTV